MTTTPIQINKLHHPVSALGPGRRAGVWMQGCSIRCAGCASLDTWDTDPQRSVPVDDVLGWIDRCAGNGAIDGVTISGGEPFDQPIALRALVAGIAEIARGRGATWDVLCYSGRRLRVLRRDHADLLACLDAVIAEPFRRERPTDLVWRGSANQVLAPLSALGWERYGEHVERRATAPQLQLSVDDAVWIIGVPRAGDLALLERSLGARGMTLEGVSWRS